MTKPSIDPSTLGTATRSQIRKDEHIELCHRGDVGLEGDRGLWSEVTLIHHAMPELNLGEMSLKTTIWGGAEIDAPLLLTGMTGGTDRASIVNRALSQVCEHLNIPFGLGSQRIMTSDPSVAHSFQVRRYAPRVNLISNIGVNQARELGWEAIARLCDSVESNALAIHLNPAMEMIQPGDEADREFRGGYSAIADLVKHLKDRPIIVKECGCGLSPRVITRLINLGVEYVDVSGVGGTSWVKLEALRATKDRGHSREARLGMLLADWGIPTAAAVMLASPLPVKVIASGGITNALEATKALALGADLVGLARPALQVFLDALESGDEDEAIEETIAFLDELIYGIRCITALQGANSHHRLRHQQLVIGPRLESWRRACEV